jgi:glycosyl transferase family 25
MKKFVINLKRRNDRLEKFLKNCPLPSNEITIINAFDGKFYINESKEEIELYNKIDLSLPGERGVFISHLRIYKEIVDNNYDYGLIFEDDAIFTNNFNEKYENIIINMPINTNLLYIGGRFTKDFRMKPMYSKTINNYIVEHKDMIVCGIEQDRTLHAYIISNKGAKLALDTFNNIKKFTGPPIDHWIIDLFNNNKIKIYSSYPLLCHSPMIHDSDIR